jgi:hypothetical protein
LSIGAESEHGALAVILAHGLTDVVEELRAFDPVDLVSFVRFGSFAALEDLLQSSTELFFREHTLTFGWTAGVEMNWGEGPTVTLGMEFRHGPVSVFFDLALQPESYDIQVVSTLFDPGCSDPSMQLAILAEALADARLPKRLAAVSGLRLPGRR